MLLLGFSVLKAENIISAEGYFFGANGFNVSDRYYLNNSFFVKGGVGKENLDVDYGSIDYNYGLIGVGYEIFELYYKAPFSADLSNGYDAKAKGYFGLDLNFELRGPVWALGMNLGIFSPPDYRYIDEWGYSYNSDITGFKMGFSIAYTFGDIDHSYINGRNRNVVQAGQAAGELGGQLQNANKQHTNTYSPPSYNSSSSSDSGCTSDYSCGVGYKCVKPQYNSEGICMKSVDSNDIQQFNSPQNNVGPNMNKQCTFNTDCAIGFSCVSGNCVK